MKEWNEAYDRILSDIDFNLDRPILWYGERGDRRKVNKAKCGSETMLLTELQRLHLNVRSLKLQFAIIDHCFDKATEEFDKEINNALARADYSIAAAKYDDAAQLLEDVRSMSIEFRCFAQHRIALFDRDKRQAIFKLTRWLSQTWSAAFGNLAASTRADLKARLDKATTDCDFLTPLDDKDRFDRFAG
jgi:hypothetical protein